MTTTSSRIGPRAALTTTNRLENRTTNKTTSRITSEPGKRQSWDIRGKYQDLQEAYANMQKEVWKKNKKK